MSQSVLGLESHDYKVEYEHSYCEIRMPSVNKVFNTSRWCRPRGPHQLFICLLVIAVGAPCSPRTPLGCFS